MSISLMLSDDFKKGMCQRVKLNGRGPYSGPTSRPHGGFVNTTFSGNSTVFVPDPTYTIWPKCLVCAIIRFWI